VRNQASCPYKTTGKITVFSSENSAPYKQTGCTVSAIAVFAFLSSHYMEMIQLLSVFQDTAYINAFYFMLSGPGVLFTFVM
jgi:hypothetical protein